MDSKDKRKFDETDDPLPGSILKQRKVIGPSLPPPQEAEAANSEISKEEEDEDDDDDDDDDDFGPSLPPTGPLKTHARQEPTAPDTSKPVEKESQRDQWMLQPPSHSDWSSKIDPTQLRNRKFNTGKSATAPKNMDSSWVETPEERMRRLQDAVMGVAASTNQPKDHKDASNAKLMEDQIKKYKVFFFFWHILSSERRFILYFCLLCFCSNINILVVGNDWEKHSPRKPKSG